MDDSNRSPGGRFWPQAWPPLSAVSDNCLGTQHSAVWPRRRVVLQQRQTQIVRRYSTPPACTAQAATRRHFAIQSQGRARSARYKDGSSGGAASTTFRRACQTAGVPQGRDLHLRRTRRTHRVRPRREGFPLGEGAWGRTQA